MPTLNERQIAWVAKQVATYIERQRKTFQQRAASLRANQLAAMQPFFSATTLDSAKVLVLTGKRVNNPPFYGELIKWGFEAVSLPNFSLMAAITFVDTVVSHEAFTDRLLFHELVHVVQYEKLGLEGFANKYVKGFLSGGSYEAIQLEMNAYELDARFAAAPAKPFSVEAQVRAWIDASKF